MENRNKRVSSESSCDSFLPSSLQKRDNFDEEFSKFNDSFSIVYSPPVSCDDDKVLESIDHSINNYEMAIAEAKNDGEGVEKELSDTSAQDTNQEQQSEYSVEKVVGKSLKNGTASYECKWYGWPSSSNTCESMLNLKNSLISIKEYESNEMNKFLKTGYRSRIKHSSDKYSEVDLVIWRKLRHLEKPKRIMAYDTWNELCFVSYENVPEVAQIPLSIVKEKYPKLWNDFKKRNPETRFVGKIKPLELRNEPIESPSQSKKAK